MADPTLDAQQPVATSVIAKLKKEFIGSRCIQMQFMQWEILKRLAVANLFVHELI
jgi:hypothetical protein